MGSARRGWLWMVALVVLLGIVASAIFHEEPPPSSAAGPAATATPAAKPDPTAEKVRSAALAVLALRANMRNPRSFELITAAVTEKGASCIEYRAQNGFGGYSVEKAVWGKRIATSGSDGFADAWNRECAGKKNVDLTERVQTLVESATTP